MDWMIVVGVVVGLLVGCVLGWIAAGRVSRAEAGSEVAAEIAGLRARLESQTQERARSEGHWRERVGLLERQLSEQTRAREEEARTRAAENLRQSEDEGRVLEALAPVGDRLSAMQRALAEMEQQRQIQYGALGEQMSLARESDRRLQATTSALESALRNTSARGAWGEAQLRNIVESAGLLEHVDFDVQATVPAESSRGRPDMVIHLPGGRSLPIDAKVPFDSYLEATSIPADADGPEGRRRADLLSAHVKALRGHVDALAKRAYWEGLEDSPDFVVAFIPSESLLAAAVEADPTLLDHAFGKRVALASPVTLWSVLRTVSYAWQQDVMSTEAKELFDISRELYQRLAVLGGHAEQMRTSLQRSVESWNRFAGSLESRVFVTARKLSRVDESTIIPTPRPIEDAPRLLTAPEIVETSG